jgi:pimeloyl-ACP methyl ester carboxylesterase
MKANTDLRDDMALPRHLVTCAFSSTRQRDFEQSWLALLALILLVVPGTSLYSHGQTQDHAPGPARSRSYEMLDRWNNIGNKLIARAQDFPEDKYDFKVQKDERTFAQNLLHAAALDFVLIRRVSGSSLGPDFGQGDNPSRDVFKTKADVVKFVQEAVAEGAKVIRQQGDVGLDNTSKFLGDRPAHNSSIWTFAIEHMASITASSLCTIAQTISSHRTRGGEASGGFRPQARFPEYEPIEGLTLMRQIRILFLSAPFIFTITAVLISTVAVSGQQGASSDSAPADIVYGQPGQLVDAGGFRLNLYCMGSGSPAVVFDSGFGDWAPAWSKVQPQIATWTRACSYDRAGAGFSDPGPMPRTSVRIAEELRTALHNAGIAGPYILVGHAYGGDNVRTFADLHMDEVAGLVLDDADPDDLEPKAMQEEAHRGHAGLPSDLRDCRNLIAEHKPLPAQPSGPGQPPQTCAQQFFFRGLPEAEWSPELNAKVLEIAQTKIAMYDADASEMEQTSADEAYLQQHRRSFGSRPIRVLTSGNHGVGHLEEKPPDTPKHLKYEQETTLAQARWLTLSSNSKQIFTHNSSEYIQFDEPETLMNAVREVYDLARRPVARGH